jgi:S1-C subfamily serine protease
LPNGDKLVVLVQLVGKKVILIAANAQGQPILKGGHTIAINVPSELEEYTDEATGSGFYVRPDIVATNWHVVSNPAMGDAGFRGGTAQITDKPGKYTITDKPIAFDRDHDLALLYVPGTDAKPLTLETDYSKLRVGQAVYALGSPWGLAGSLSEGIVSSDQLRPGDETNGNAQKLYIQHSAKIDHGFSGGPLLDTQGHVIGVDTAGKGNGAVNLSVAAHFIDDLLERPSTQAQIEKLSKSSQVDLHG